MPALNTFSTASLIRISQDPKLSDHHAACREIIDRRTGGFDMQSAVAFLSLRASQQKTASYAEVVYHTSIFEGWQKGFHRNQLFQFLGQLAEHCFDKKLPVLCSLVVDGSTGEVGDSFLQPLIRAGLATEGDDPASIAKKERQRCYAWAEV